MTWFKPISDDQFRQLKAHWRTLTANDKENIIDSRFLSLIDKINNHCDLQTLYCCSGHVPGDIQYSKGGAVLSSYISFTYNCYAEPILVQILKEINQLGGSLRSEIPGRIPPNHWVINPESSVAATPYHGFRQWAKVNSFAIYFHVPISDDPTGKNIVQSWESLFNKILS